MGKKPLLATVSLAILAILLFIPAHDTYTDEGDDYPQYPVPGKAEPRYPNLGSGLNQLVANFEPGQAVEKAADNAAVHNAGMVAVTIYLSGETDVVVAFLEDNGGSPRNVGEDYIEAHVPATLLGQVSEQPGVIRIREIIPPQQAAHVAGTAALMRQGFPHLTAAQVASYLKDNAEQRGSPDPNNTWGHGFAKLPLSTPAATCLTGGAVADTANNRGLAADCELLLAAKDTLAGTQGMYWFAFVPIDQWIGVTVAGTPPRVTGLNLRRLGLNGRIPAELGNMINLEYLGIWGNQLTGIIPPELGQLTNLRSLVLGANKLTGPIPSALGDLPNLQELYLWGNELTGPIPASLSSLTNLKDLRLSDNRLSGPVPSWLGSLTNLEVLTLDENQLTGTIPAELGNLSNLQGLVLWRNQLTGTIPAELGNLSNLRALLLRGNQLTGPIPAELGNLSNLQRLTLRGNQLSGPIPAELGNLSNLQWLYLSENQLSGPIPAELGNLSNLQVLYLLGNQLTGTIPTEMGSLAKLEELFLSGNQLTGCIPVGIAAVANNDLNQLGLPFCAGALGPPTISSITPGVASISVTWAAPSMASGVTIIAYGLRYIESAASDKSDANWTMVDNAWTTGSGALSYQISGLTSGTQYDVQVRAVTAAGDGLWSVAAAVTPATWAAIRSFSSASVSPGGQVMVTITANGYGEIGLVVDTLPPGFSLVASSLLGWASTDGDREVRFVLRGETILTYTVTAPSAAGSYSFSGVWGNSNTRGEEAPVGGALSMTVWSLPSVIVSRAAGSEDTEVRLGSPVSLTATFSRPVSGFTVDDITIGNGTVGNFAGSGAVYTFDVTPNEIGEVTVDIAAGAAEDADGNGNTVAPRFSVGITYDDDDDGDISTAEVLAAIIVSRAAGSEDTEVRLGSPVSLTATFSRPVSGFTVDDITIGNGTVGNFAGSGAVYTFDVTPNEIGEVTVDIAAGAAEDANGNGNTAAPRLSVGITYDDDGDGAIDISELFSAIDDYFAGRIDISQLFGVIDLYFSGPTPTPRPT